MTLSKRQRHVQDLAVLPEISITPTGRAARVCRPYEAASASSVPMRPAPERLILHGHTSLVQKAFTRRAGVLGISCAVREALAPAVRARYNGARAIQPSALLA